ncbi:hypothetical protein [Acinetobacter tjernbergiae]|uniref:Uncharacterized protein n=1 Tax=Acinetobacter tjernbergiae DSM 14971 = CIP 107465 TaxID=1120928 RepID=V2V6Y0_9GAMM|nr:hypothetical protein [Acinetobacter tjernbergiae]ESK56631.1 hypothetical protein F990_00966 [Acinetobacter tjernbergiae DSM 14971 = CIP 107465]
MKKILTISEYIALFKKTWNPWNLIKAFYLIVSQRRLFEAAYGVYCHIRIPPSDINHKIDLKSFFYLNDNLKDKIFCIKANLSREELICLFGADYAVDDLPCDFYRARIESIVLYEDFLIIGEYGNPGKRIAIVSKTSCLINKYYDADDSVKHIHVICSATEEGLILVSTGDTAKYLDLWDLDFCNLKFVKRIKNLLAGYTAIIKIDQHYFFGTDFSSRPNYLAVFCGKSIKKYAFPSKSYKMYVVRFLNYNNHYILCLNKEMQCFGGRYALSIFDVIDNEFIFCDYVEYDEPKIIDEVLHRTIIEQRSRFIF